MSLSRQVTVKPPLARMLRHHAAAGVEDAGAAMWNRMIPERRLAMLVMIISCNIFSLFLLGKNAVAAVPRSADVQRTRW